MEEIGVEEIDDLELVNVADVVALDVPEDVATRLLAAFQKYLKGKK